MRILGCSLVVSVAFYLAAGQYTLAGVTVVAVATVVVREWFAGGE